MSFETDLHHIATSLAIIAEALTKHAAAPQAPQVVPAPVQAAPAPAPKVAPTQVPVMIPTEQNLGNVQPAPTPTAPVTATPVAPAAATPVSASPSDCPIVDQPSLVAYVMGSYKEMGPVKGNMIQGVLAGQGISNINEAKPEQYAAIYAGVEALKAQ
jgi:hypothetical protein